MFILSKVWACECLKKKKITNDLETYLYRNACLELYKGSWLCNLKPVMSTNLCNHVLFMVEKQQSEKKHNNNNKKIQL